MGPAPLISFRSTPYAVETIAKSRSMAPPIRLIPESAAMSATPASPPVAEPPQ